MPIYQLKPSFAAGELAPSLYGRTDLQKYDIGAALIENMIVLRYGGVSRRPGFKFVAKTGNGNKARLIPFRYNTSQNYIIEITAGLFRFYTDGGLVLDGNGLPYTVANNFTDTELATIKYAQSADTMILVQPNHAPMTLTRYGAASWVLATMDITGGPFEDGNTNEDLKITASGATGNITLAASGNYFTGDMVGRSIRLGYTIPSRYAKGVPGKDTIDIYCPPGGTVYVESFGFWSGSFTLKQKTNTGGWVDVRTQEGNHSQNYNFTSTNETDEIIEYKIESSNFDTTIWSGENDKQTGFVTLQTFAKDYYGICKVTGVYSATSATATVIRALYTNGSSVAATNDFALSPWSAANGYPGTVGFFEDRLIFAGSKKYPQTYWASKNGDYYNFGTSIPSADDDAVTGTLNNGQMNGIKAIVTFSQMLMQTAGGSYLVGSGNDPLTYKNQQSKPQEYRGINDLTPCVIGSRIVFVQQQGNSVRDIGYDYNNDKYQGDDVSLLATHLFEGRQIVSMTYQQIPNSIVWCVRDDGVLLGMTYIKEQDVYAWHRHSTQGKFIDVCSISGDNEDELWAVVYRYGSYYVELMGSQIQGEEPADQFYLDCGVQVTGNTGKTISGLTWLNGLQVQILADGNVLPVQTVTGNAVALDNVYKTVSIGLGYKSRLQTLPIDFNGNDGTYASRKKRVTKLMVMFKASRGGVYGVNEEHMDEIKWRSNEPWNTPISLYTGKQFVSMPASGYEDTVQIMINQGDPLPMNILSIVPEVIPGG